jgi:DNA-binding transcriptional ArsR family regulator
MRTNTGRGYRIDKFKKAEETFYILAKEYDTQDKVIRQKDICRRADISHATMSAILRDAPWWHERRKLNAGKHYSIEAFKRVENAFYALVKEYDPDGITVMPEDIRDRAGISRSVMTDILRDAIWWDDKRRQAMRDEICRRAREKNTGRGYTIERRRMAEEAFCVLVEEYDLIGRTITPEDICERTGISRRSMYDILRDAPWWDISRKDAMRADVHQRKSIAMITHGSLGIKEAQKKHCAIQSAYHIEMARRSEEVFYILTKEYDPIGKVILPGDIRERIGVSRSRMYKILRDASWWDDRRKTASREEIARRGRDLLRVQGNPNIKKALLVNIGQKHPMPSNHPRHVIGNNTRIRILEALDILTPNVTQKQIAEYVGVNQSAINKHLHILRSQGIIDEHNRPIQQDTA